MSDKPLTTKSQMIWRIAELSEQNTQLRQKLEEIRQFCSCYSENDIAKPIFEVILNLIDDDSELLPDDEIPF